MWKIGAVVPLIFAGLVLAGCGKSSDRQEAACELDAWKFSELHAGGDFRLRAGMTETCMRAHGFKFNNDYCPDEDKISKDAPLSIRLSSEPMQMQNPKCYRRDW